MESYGTLVSRVFTGWAQTPVEKASVSITLLDERGRRELLALRSTNDSGMIARLSIETPSRRESLSPSSTIPFARCDVRVSHPDYQTLVVEDVQIFPGVESVLPLHLIPLPFTGSEGADRVEIPPQDL